MFVELRDFSYIIYQHANSLFKELLKPSLVVVLEEKK